MSPATPRSASAQRRRTSSSEPTPPDAITGIVSALGERRGLLEVRPGAHAVARDVGVDDRRDAGVLEAARERRAPSCRWCRASPAPRPCRRARRCRRRCGPGWRRAASRTSAGSRSAAVPSTTRSTPSASRASTSAGVRMPPPTCTGTCPAAARIARDRGGVLGPAGARAVEIDDVQPAQRVRGEARGDRGRVVAVDRRRVVAPLREPHAAALEEVDRGDQLEGGGSHGASFRGAARRRRRADRHRRGRLRRAPLRELVDGEPARAAARVARRGEDVVGERPLRLVEDAGPELLALRRGVERDLEPDARRARFLRAAGALLVARARCRSARPARRSARSRGARPRAARPGRRLPLSLSARPTSSCVVTSMPRSSSASER